MADKYSRVTVIRPNKPDIVLVGSTTDHTYKIIGNQVFGFENSWNMDGRIHFQYTLSEGDAVIIDKSSDDDELISEIKKQFAALDVAQANLTKSIGQAEYLRNSFLSAAFQGQLIAQDPNDDPAQY